jgi:hypothetical protein
MSNEPIKVPHIPAYGVEIETSLGPARILIAQWVTRLDLGNQSSYFNTDEIEQLLDDASSYIGYQLRHQLWLETYLAELKEEVEQSGDNDDDEHNV